MAETTEFLSLPHNKFANKRSLWSFIFWQECKGLNWRETQSLYKRNEEMGIGG